MILGIGCVYFAVHVAVDYLKHKLVVEPKIERLEQVKGELRLRSAKSRRSSPQQRYA